MEKLKFLKGIDKNLIFLLAGYYTLFDIVFLSKKAYFCHFYPEENKVDWSQYLVYTILVDWLVVVGFMSLIAISTKHLLHLKFSWLKIICLHVFLSILIGIFIQSIFLFVGFASGNFSIQDYSLRESINSFVYVLDLNFLIYFSMVFIIYIYYYIKQVRESERQKNALERQLVKTRMKMLTSQLQPHFLFNTLNSIAVLSDTNSTKAKDTIADLSDFLREILYSGDVQLIPLSQELRTLESYLNILNVRFSNDLQIDHYIENRLMNRNIPAFVLQPLIENSVKHGYSLNHPELKIKYSVYREENWIVIKVENDGAPLNLKSSYIMKNGVGLSNIKDRLKSIYAEDYEFVIQNRKDDKGNIDGVETIIKIPYNWKTI